MTATYALHVGLAGESNDSETLAPIVTKADGTTLDQSDLWTEEGGHNLTDTPLAYGILVRGSWQEWSEPTAEDVTDWHVVITSGVPFTAERIKEAVHTLYSLVPGHGRSSIGRVLDVLVTSDGDDWSEDQRLWTYTGSDVEGPYVKEDAGSAPARSARRTSPSTRGTYDPSAPRDLDAERN